MKHHPSDLPSPLIVPTLDPGFRPSVLANRSFREAARAAQGPAVQIALEQADGSVFHHSTVVFPEQHSRAASNIPHLLRLTKFLLWSRGGYRIYLDGPASLIAPLQRYYQEDSAGKFDAQIMGQRIYEKPFEIVRSQPVPPPHASTAALGRHLDGCRIGFDLGGSDRKVAAVIDGQVVFSEEIVWDPVPQSDPQYHFDGVMDSLQRAAKHLPRVDAIGGSAAGVYVNNQVKVASLFRGLPPHLFETRAKNLFYDLRAAWNNIPFEVVNDGEVTALAGSMALGANAVLGIAMGTSQAGGYVTPDGTITSWLNELAFTPVDDRPDAPVDEWSGDSGCGAQYFSQQAVGRLLPAAGLEIDPALPLPEKLKAVQAAMNREDPRAARIYQTIGVYLGYALAHYSEFYAFQHVLLLGRVTTGPGGDLILHTAKEVLKTEFPDLSNSIRFHTPDEKEKRHGQAIAAASLPQL